MEGGARREATAHAFPVNTHRNILNTCPDIQSEMEEKT